MFTDFQHLSMITANIRNNMLTITRENEKLRKEYSDLQNNFNNLKIEYDKLIISTKGNNPEDKGNN